MGHPRPDRKGDAADFAAAAIFAGKWHGSRPGQFGFGAVAVPIDPIPAVKGVLNPPSSS